MQTILLAFKCFFRWVPQKKRKKWRKPQQESIERKQYVSSRPESHLKKINLLLQDTDKNSLQNDIYQLNVPYLADDVFMT